MRITITKTQGAALALSGLRAIPPMLYLLANFGMYRLEEVLWAAAWQGFLLIAPCTLSTWASARIVTDPAVTPDTIQQTICQVGYTGTANPYSTN